ncbi:MAG: serine protease [Hydrogenophilales bacterium]|nr:serine protease [Hydrogenophilales bacterium]
MRTAFRNATLAAALIFVAFTAHAKTASDIYEQAAKSTVVVENINAKGKAQSMGSGVVFADGNVAANDPYAAIVDRGKGVAFGDGNVVTNCHVIKGANKLKVRIGVKEHAATLRYSDWDRDVCSLSVAGLTAPAVAVGNTKTLKVGAKVYAIGAPKGLELTLSDGIVSSLREVEGGRYIQTTAAISPGSSGGGLFDENGALVGLTTFYLSEGQNLNFAVPVEWVKELPKRSTKAAAVTTVQPVTEWLNKAIELQSRKAWPALLEHSRRWTKARPGSGTAWYSLGIAYDKAGQTAKAIEAYQQALRIDPEDAEAWNNLGYAYDIAGQIAKAIEAYQQALRINPAYAAAWYNLGIAYDNAGQIAKAIEAYQQALRINPEDANAWNNLGVAYDNAGQTARAIEAYQQALRINPEDAKAWYNLGIAYDKASQSAKAIEAYQQALRINPEHAKAWNNLGIYYALSGQRGKVMEVYKQLKTLDPVLAERFFNKVVIP